jgi:hypothetical protein
MSVHTTAQATTSPTSTRHRWVPAVGALAGLTLTVKAGLIIGTGDDVADQPMAILYLTGIVVGVAAAVGFGLRRSPLALRIATAIVAPLLLVAWIMGLGEVVEPLFGMVNDAQYVRDEGPIGLLGLVLLTASFVGYSRDQRA